MEHVITKKNFLYLILSAISTNGFSANVSNLIDEYGKRRVMEIIRSQSNGWVAVDLDGSLDYRLGNQSPEYITFRSINADLARLGINPGQLKTLIEKYI